jgi:hypothetical protein
MVDAIPNAANKSFIKRQGPRQRLKVTAPFVAIDKV